MDKPTQPPGTKSFTASPGVGQDDVAPSSTGQSRIPVHEVTEHDYTLPQSSDGSSRQPDASLCDVSGLSQEHDTEESGRRIVTAVRRLRRADSGRRDSNSSSGCWSTCSGSSSNGSGGDSASSGGGSGGSSSGTDSGSTGSSSSCHSLYTRSYIPLKEVCIAPNTTDLELGLPGGDMEMEATVPSEVEPRDVSSHSHQMDTAAPLEEKTIIQEKPFFKVTRLSETSSDSSNGSDRSKTGRRTAVQGICSDKFIESADINKAYEKAKDLKEEAQRERNTWDLVRKCIEAVGSRVSYLQTLAKTVLGDLYEPPDSLWNWDVDPSTSDLDVSKCSSDYELRLKAVHTSLIEAYAEMVSEEMKEVEIPSPTTSRECSREFIREVIRKDAELLSQSSSSDESEEFSLVLGILSSVGGSSNKDERKRHNEVIQALKSAHKSLKSATRKKEMLTEISKTAEQSVKEIKATYGNILVCMNCTIHVVRPALEADRILRKAMRKASSETAAGTDSLTNYATKTSRLVNTAVSYAEETEEYRAEAIDALSDAENSQEEISMDDSVGDDIVLETSLIKDHMDMLVEDMSDINLEQLQYKSDIVKYNAGSVHCALKYGRVKNASMDALHLKCNSVWLQLLASLVAVTKVSVDALNAARDALEEFQSRNRRN